MKDRLAPAVVVGADINGLGVVRSLVREGIVTYLCDTDSSQFAMRTRSARKVHFRSLSGPVVIEDLLVLRRRFTVDPVLFLTREATVKAVSDARDEVSPCYRFSMPASTVMERLMSKSGFQTLAQEYGFAIPKGLLIRNAEDVLAAKSLDFPCVLKPIAKNPAYDAHFKKAYKIDDHEHLVAICGEIDGAAELIVQEWVQGADDQIYFCLQYRRTPECTAASFVGRKLRSWPPQTGGTASCVPAPEFERELTFVTNTFFAAAGFFGIGSMEFKRDSRTRQFMMIEPTVGRTDFQEEIATLNGVNIPYAAYCGTLGIETLPSAPSADGPAAWVVSDLDRWSSELQPQLRGFPKDLRRYDAVLRLHDPLPWCYAMTARIRSAMDGLKSRT